MPVDLGRGHGSKKEMNESVMEEEIITEHDKSNITAQAIETP